MAAISSAAATAPPSRLGRPIFAEPSSRLSTSRSLHCWRIWGNEAGKNPRRLFTLQKRRVLPKVEAKKQTFSSFDDLLKTSTTPVLVDFYATWCGPCQFMIPILDEVSIKMDGRISVVKIDTEKYPSIANRYNIQALPTFILFRDGKPFDRFEGALPADQLIERIQNAIEVAK